MNLFSKLLPSANVVISCEAADKSAALDALADVFAASTGCDRQRVGASLVAREQLGSTGLGQGVAVPHGRLKGLKRASAAVMRLAHPIAFDAPDGRPVDLLLALLVPENATEEHLEVLSELAQMLSDRELRSALLAEATAAGVQARIVSWECIRPAA